jgi:ABC-2 type transport system ATP-binding protein
MTSATSIVNLSVHYGRRIAVKNVSVTLLPGQITLLLGPNGAGKSTLLSAVSGAIAPSAGTIHIDGQPADTVKHKIGFADQPPSLYEYFTVSEHVGFVAEARNSNQSAAQAVLQQLGLGNILNRPCRELSFGMRQRVGMAAALVGDTSVILLDETLNGLDPHATRHAITALRTAANRGAAVLMSTHLLGSAERACDRVLLMFEGELLEDIHGVQLSTLLASSTTALEDLYLARIPDQGPT